MRVVAIASGGMDSATMLWWLRNEGYEVKALGFDYGQRHAKELEHLNMICGVGKFALDVVDCRSLRSFLGGSSQTDDKVEVPEGHYADASMKLTVVPNRNMIMIAIAAGHAVSLGYEMVAYGAHAGDHPIYPDCRPRFAMEMSAALMTATGDKVTLIAPFIHDTKSFICERGLAMGVPYNLTWSCYKGGEKHCGKCGTCVERLEAFHDNGVEDVVEYE